MFIGTLSSESGFSKDTIRYYEKIGLIKSSGYVRQSNRYKSYSAQTLERLQQIQKLKTSGFTLTEITDMLDSFNDNIQPCKDLPANLIDKLGAINEKIALLETYKRSVQKMLNACDAKCAIADGLPSCIRC